MASVTFGKKIVAARSLGEGHATASLVPQLSAPPAPRSRQARTYRTVAAEVAELEDLLPAFRATGCGLSEDEIERVRVLGSRVENVQEDALGTFLPTAEPTFIPKTEQFEGGSCKQLCYAVNLTSASRIAVAVCKHVPSKQPQIERDVQFASLSGEHIIETLFVGRDERHGRTYIGMKYYSKGDLSQLIKSPPPLLKARLKIALQLAKGVQHLHDRGILHRDIKPDNFLMDVTGNIVICDFGMTERLAHLQGVRVEGTPEYMAPEIFNSSDRDKDITEAYDIWALGVIFFQLFGLTTLPWFDYPTDDWEKVVDHVKDLPADWLPPVPKGTPILLKELLIRMLRVDPKRRWNIDQVIDSLENVLRNERARESGEWHIIPVIKHQDLTHGSSSS